MMRSLIFSLAAMMALAEESEMRLVRVADGIRNPTDIQAAGDGSGRLFVTQQNGVIRTIRDGVLVEAPFLDIRARTRTNSECGLLGVAFPPGFADKRYFYVDYTDPNCRNTIVARYRLGEDGNGDAASEEVILRQPQPYTNHNGGQLRFGRDGYLYISFGDGGSGGDPQNNAVNRGTWLGKILRIDTESEDKPYRVPPDNPFVNETGVRGEIWAYGLRNPWRFSFDRETGDLWIGDVGQDQVEEIDFQPASSKGGENYGWRTMEGSRCYNPGNNCDERDVVKPVYEYSTRRERDVCVIGGFVYRGSLAQGLRGTYVFGDNSSGRIWGLRREEDKFQNRLLLESRMGISTFGEDEAGELYVADHGGGVIYRVEGPVEPQ